MIRKYHNHKLQTNPWHHEEEPRQFIQLIALYKQILVYKLSNASMPFVTNDPLFEPQRFLMCQYAHGVEPHCKSFSHLTYTYKENIKIKHSKGFGDLFRMVNHNESPDAVKP